ncbi:hypothetical protein B7P43_G12153 [Cryptotermes secundus]|uniref:Transmembrane protein 70-like protein, mitochondrial n=1 Tax=Cryptotermes secundus TaxID=105785 RepID=A0A2J7QPE6_9NEOP|nr:hypothetical protein B7P43_G12153 [Cryptotermes secundus]
MIYTDSLKRAFCRIRVLRAVTYRNGILIGHPGILCLARRKFGRISFSQKTEERYKSMDKVPLEYELIYRAPMISYMKIAQVTSSFSVLALCVVGAYKYITDPINIFPLTFKLNEYNELGDIELGDNLFPVVSVFIIFNVGISAVTLRYPLRIYHHEEANSYICVKNRFLPLTTKKITFHAGDVQRHVPRLSFLLPWRNALFKVQKRTMFIMENNFRTPADFNTMLKIQ